MIVTRFADGHPVPEFKFTVNFSASRLLSSRLPTRDKVYQLHWQCTANLKCCFWYYDCTLDFKTQLKLVVFLGLGPSDQERGLRRMGVTQARSGGRLGPFRSLLALRHVNQSKYL